MFDLQDSGKVGCDCGNATVFFAKPKTSEAYTERYKVIQEQYKLQSTPEISAAFFFDVALRTLLATK
jgi:hypothetical protein